MYSGILEKKPDEDNSSLIDDPYFEASIHDPLGLIPEDDAIKMKLMFPEYHVKRFTYLFKTRQVEKVEEICLSNEFKNNNFEFVKSGDLPFLAMNFYQYELVDKLIDFGYEIPANLIIRAIQSGDRKLTENFISKNLYSKQVIDLAFWLMLKVGFKDTAESFFDKENSLSDLFMGYNIQSFQSITSFLTAIDTVIRIIKASLWAGEDEIACDLLLQTPVAIDSESVKLAIQSHSIETLKIIWTGNIIPSTQSASKRARKCVIWEKLNLDITDRLERKKINRMLRISSIINTLLLSNLTEKAAKVLDWPDACNESGILRVLTNHEQVPLMMKYLEHTQIDVTGSEFMDAFDKKFFKACVKMLKFKEPRGTLIKKHLQENLILLLDEGVTCLEAIQILSYINHRDWTTDLTVSLCEHLDTLINESEELSSCPNPLLFCVLVVEFLQNVSLNSAQNKHRCLECAESFFSQVLHLEKAIKETEVLEFLLMDTDCRGRSSLVIMSENGMLSLLEGLKVGAIVSRMWKGKDAENLWNASRIFNSLKGGDDFLTPVEFQKTQFHFSFSVWIKTCSIRAFTGSYSLLFLLFVYTALIIQGTEKKNFMDLQGNDSTHSLLRLSQILIIGLMVDLVMQYIFTVKAGRDFIFDAMRILDVIIFGMMLLILAGLQDEMGEGKTYSGTDPILFVGLIHSLENLFIWVRVLLLLITTKRLGPFLIMIFHIMKKMISFYFLFACFSIWFAAVFTALFSDQLPGTYGSFWISMRTLYSSSLGGFNFDEFHSTNKVLLGALLLGLYLIITNIILLNLFVALFTTIYQQISEQVESTYRSAVIMNFEKWRWDERFGLLTLYSSPFSALSAFFLPFLMFSKDPRRFNMAISKYLYALVYGVCEMIILIVIDLILIPVVYLTGFLHYPKRDHASHVSAEDSVVLDEKSYNWKFTFIWLFGGIPIIFYHIYIDLVTFWKIVFKDYEDVKTFHPFACELNIKIMKETLKHIQPNLISPDELANLWAYTKSLITSEKEKPEELAHALDFCIFFTNSTKDRSVNVRLMERLLTGIDEKELGKFSYIRVPFVNKAIANYRNLLGGVEVEGVVLPKKLGQPGGPVDINNMMSTFKLMQQMENQVDYFLGVVKNLKEIPGN
jgi:hypothetical protein